MVEIFDSEAATAANTGRVVDSSAIGDFDFAIACTCAWLIPHLISRQRLYHRSLKRSPMWLQEHVMVPLQLANPTEAKAYAEREVNRAMMISILSSLFFYSVTALVLSLLSRDMDYRTSYILVGISYFVGAYYLFLLSYSAPQWMAVLAVGIFREKRRTQLGANLKALTWKTGLHCVKTFFTIYPMIIPFFCGAKPLTIPVSVFAGVGAGVTLCFCIDWGNRNVVNKKRTRVFAFGIAFCFILASGALFAYGCGYVQDIWGSTEKDDNLLEGLAFVSWVVAGVLLHLLAWRVSSRMRRSGDYEGAMKRPKTFFGKSVYLSARNFSKRKLMDRSSQAGEEQRARKMSAIEESDEEEERSRMSSKRDNVEVSSNREQHMEMPQTVEENAPYDEDTNHDQDEHGHVETETEFEVPLSDKHKKGEIDSRGPANIEETAPGTDLEAAATTNEQSHHGKKFDSLFADSSAKEDEDDDDLDAPSHIANIICCNETCGLGGKNKSFLQKTSNCCSWTAWSLLLGASFFFVIMIIGAEHQSKEVRDKLPLVHEILYDNMNDGEVCAFDDRFNGTRQAKVDLTQRTFASREDAHAAGYSIMHCGACGACSDWNDSRVQFTTREILGQVALKCAKKVLFGGGFEKLLECTMEETGFMEDCGRCWTQDYICVKKNCIWISIRAFMINTVTNLQVGADDITPSTCEEAFCEATEITGYIGFVPCSGASRRRMNITSSITRPGNQQCRIVDVPSWPDFYGPSTGNGDFVPGWGNTTEPSNPEGIPPEAAAE